MDKLILDAEKFEKLLRTVKNPNSPDGKPTVGLVMDIMGDYFAVSDPNWEPKYTSSNDWVVLFLRKAKRVKIAFDVKVEYSNAPLIPVSQTTDCVKDKIRDALKEFFSTRDPAILVSEV